MAGYQDSKVADPNHSFSHSQRPNPAEIGDASSGGLSIGLGARGGELSVAGDDRQEDEGALDEVHLDACLAGLGLSVPPDRKAGVLAGARRLYLATRFLERAEGSGLPTSGRPGPMA